MDDSPVAMPTPFGYIQPQTLAQVIEKYQKGMEDPGDVLARQVGGSHYKKAHQPWEIIEEWGLGVRLLFNLELTRRGQVQSSPLTRRLRAKLRY